MADRNQESHLNWSMAAMSNVIVRTITMDIVETPIFIKLGDRNRPIYTSDGEIVPETGILRDVHIRGIRAKVNDAEKYSDAERAMHNYVPYASSITGIPGAFVERVYISDVEIEILGGFPPGTVEDAQRTIEENSTKYPENRMFGVLPAYAFYVRHARDIHFRDIRVVMRQEDARSAFVLDNVHDATFVDVRAEAVSQTPTIHVADNCSGVEIAPEPPGA